MIKKFIGIGYFFIAFIFSSCGPSAQERAANEKRKADSIAIVEKNRMDSVAKATELRIATKQNLQDTLRMLSTQKEGMENRLMSDKGNLEVEKDKLDQLKRPQFGRTQAERETQIKNQTILIETTEKEISDLENGIHNMETSIQQLQANLKNYQ